MSDGCIHEMLHQVSEATLRTTWERRDDGIYIPDAEPKVLGEDTGTFTCVACGTVVDLLDDARIEPPSDENVVSDRCPECNEYEPECLCAEDAR